MNTMQKAEQDEDQAVKEFCELKKNKDDSSPEVRRSKRKVAESIQRLMALRSVRLSQKGMCK